MTDTHSFDLIDRTFSGPFGKLPLATYLRSRGRSWGGHELPANVKKAPNRQCFRNAWALSVFHGFRYCEGYGWDIALGELPIYHAWNLCPTSGRVIDATWAIGRSAVYLGIELSPKQLATVIDTTGCFEVLQDGNRAALHLLEQVLNKTPKLTLV